MEPKDTLSNVTHLPRPILGADEALTSSLKNSEPRQVNITLHGENQLSLAKNAPSVVDLVIQEINLWANVIGKRKLHSLAVYHPFQCLASFDITQIVHTIASRFLITKEPASRLCVSEMKYIDEDKLALLRGLGFNIFQMFIANASDRTLRSLCEQIKYLRHFEFACVGVQISHLDDLNTIRETAISVKETCRPDYICAGQSDAIFEITGNNDIEHFKQNNGYDLIGLGTGSKSQISTYKLEGMSSPARYMNSLKNNNLPVVKHR